MQINRPISGTIYKGTVVGRRRANSRRRHESGFVIILVAVFLLFVVGAMAALSIDVVTFYTARSEAQLAADAAALAGGRVLANSGATSDLTGGTLGPAEGLASAVATQVALSNTVGGQTLSTGQVQVWFNATGSNPCTAITGGTEPNNPCVTVQVTANLPVFFARIWGSTQVTIAATATAEAFNPSGLSTDLTTSVGAPVAPSCVKPWLLPNIDPTTNNPIFDRSSGQIQNSSLLGLELPSFPVYPARLHASCESSTTCGTLQPWTYFVGDDKTSFPPPTKALPACTLSSNFQLSIAGCVQTPIICGAPPASQVTIQLIPDSTLDQQAADAVNCLAHTSGGQGDTINAAMGPPIPFEFTAGADNPLVQAGTLTAGWSSMVSDSLVTVPIFDTQGLTSTSTTVNVIGYLQLFLEPSGQPAGSTGVDSKIINMVGCGINSNATNSTVPVYGNGASAVPVRLISHP